jgi:hypothetical protein
MKYSEINRYLYVFKTVFVGLIATQAIGTFHVYLSNISLYQGMQMIQKAGYLAVPNENIWPTLQGFGAAFWGGLFFTLSLGTGLSVVALIACWVWDRLFRRNKAVLFIYLLLWIMGIGTVNANGFSTLATAYIAIIPPLVFLATLFLLPPGQAQGDRIHKMAYHCVPVVLILVFLPLAQKSIFLDIRDTVLLSNPIGIKINQFYYNYTLYAAQAFKSLEQKTLRTCRLVLTENESHRSAIEHIFITNDYLVIDGEGPADLSVVEQDGKLLFRYGNKIVFTPTLREFTAKPSTVLQQFSQKTDRFGQLRLAACASMTIGAPLCLYIIIHGLFFLVFSLFMVPKRAGFSALLLCTITGIAIAIPLYGIKTQTVNADNLNTVLESEHWQERMAALRYIERNNLPNDKIIAEAQSILAHPHVAERYWFARALGSSKSPEAGEVLLSALDDSNTNVVSMAFYSLGKRGDGEVVAEILTRMKTSNKWYEQWYAYRALRSIGWQQGN